MKFRTALTLKLVALTFAAVNVAYAQEAPGANTQVRPSIPAWVRSGVEVVYESGQRNLVYPSAIVVTETNEVISNGNGVATGITNVRVAGSFSENFRWAVNAAGAYSGYDAQFWVDPKDPIGSIHGPNGEPYTVNPVRGVLKIAGKTWNATYMSYSNPATKVQYVVVFDTVSGLILEETASTPAIFIQRNLYSTVGF